MKRNFRGFTLIELLVVIAIIGILATIVLVSLGTARRRARDTRRIGDLRQVALALQLYREDNTGYPAALTGLVPNFMRALPKDPSTGADYGYGIDGATPPQDYVLRTVLEVATNQALNPENGDIDDSPIYTLDCTDPAYCIRPQ